MFASTSTNGHDSFSSNGLVLNIGVVGAGIAGLAAAAALVRAGHCVKIFERSRFSNEVGAAVHLGPNAVPVLRAIGFDVKRAKLMKLQEGVQFNGITLDEVYRGDYSHYEEKFKAPWYLAHRVDLHEELRRLVLEPGEQFQAAKLCLASPVGSVDCENGVIVLEDGTQIEQDVIVGADGVHSVVAQCVLGDERTARVVNECAYRFLIPTKRLLASPITKSLFEEDKTTFHIAGQPDRRLVWYPCRGGELQNFVALHPPEHEHAVREEDWHAGGQIDDLVATYSTFHPKIIEICRMAEDLKLWQLVYRKPVKRWTKGRVILIGDAIHPMLPHQGQGAAQAVEDAGALGVFLSKVQSLDDIPMRLKQAQDARRDRASAMQIFSNVPQDQPQRIENEARAYVKGPIPKNQPEFHQWNFSYDVVADCQARLKVDVTGN